MLPDDLLTPEQIRIDDAAASKKKALESIAGLFAASVNMPNAETIFKKLLEREQLGSTGMNHGIALPHARMKGISKPQGALVRLRQGVDFDALDDQPVDLLFGLLVPENATEEHLSLLASLARLFSDQQLCNQLRQAKTTQEIMELLYPQPLADAAAR